MKKSGILNHRLSDVIARMGHTQRLVVADAGLPVPLSVERIDLSVVASLPTTLQLVTAIAGEMEVEAIVVADELLARDRTLVDAVAALFPNVPISSVPHLEFKAMSESAVAIVRSGECTPFANIMLISGVTF